MIELCRLDFSVLSGDRWAVQAWGLSSGVPTMIDLHSHILPAIDDGAADLAASLAMARASVADGVTVQACTPHILPGVYQNSAAGIASAVQSLQQTLDDQAIALRLIVGADIHMVPDLVAGLRSGTLPTLGGSRYALIEPPSHVAPPRLNELFFQVIVAGFVPILTHPERLTWIEGNYPLLRELTGKGVWMQITAGSLLGGFGRRPKYWAERMLEDGQVHILATDAHDTRARPPCLGRGRDAAAKLVGDREAEHLVLTRPLGIVTNSNPADLPRPRSGRAEVEVEHGQRPIQTTSVAGDRRGGTRGDRAQPRAGGWLARGLRRLTG